MPYELFIALRYLRAKRKQVMISVITVIAISAVAAGVASLILVLGMMTGFREDFQTKILSGTQDMNVLRKDGRQRLGIPPDLGHQFFLLRRLVSQRDC